MGLVPIFSPCAPKILSLFDSHVQDVFVASAFLRIEAVSEMLARLLRDRTTPCRLRVLTRVSFSDILAGASDFASLALLTKARHSYLSIDCRRDPRLHAKIYVVDAQNAIITSANLTPPGLLTNIEFGMFIDSTEIVKNILDYFEPIWQMAERFDENVLSDLSAGVEEGRSESPSEIDRNFPERIVRKRQSPKSKRSLARLPKTELVKLNADWDELNKLGMNVQTVRATIASGTLKKALRRTVRVYDKTKQFDIGSDDTISPEEVILINNVELLKKLMLTNPNWELRDAAAEALGNIFGDKATRVLLEALQREDDRDVLWSILISLKPRISEQNLDQVLELLKRTDDGNLLYSIYLIAATIKPQLYGAELIRRIPNINDNDYLQEVESALRGLSDSELVELTISLKDWTNTFKKALFLLFLGRVRGDEVENQIKSVLFPNQPEGLGRGEGATPLIDLVVHSLLQESPRSEKHWSEIIPNEWKRDQVELERMLTGVNQSSPRPRGGFVVDAASYDTRGTGYIGKSQYDLAISDFSKALEINPNFANAYRHRGRAYYLKGQYDQAISDYTKALEINPKHGAKVYNRRGNAYHQKGQYDQAISDFNKALDINPSYADVYANRGLAYYFKKEFDKSWDDIKKAQGLGYQVPPNFLHDLRKASGRQD